MKKLVVHLVLAIFCFSIIVALMPGVYAQTNILSNPGFENGMSSWIVSSGNAVYSIDTTTRHSGASSVMGIETSWGSLGRLFKDVTGLVTPGNQYKISGWIKTRNVTGNVVIGLDYVTSNNYTPNDGLIKEIGQVTGTHDWAFYESPAFTVPPMPSDAIAVYFLFDFNMGGGTAWWDDVSLTLISQQNSTTTDGWPMFGHDLTGARYSRSTAPHTVQLLWNKTMDERVRSAVTVFGDKAYVGTFGGHVYALNASTGAQVWRFAAASKIWSTPTIANGFVYVGCVDPCYMYALNASTGDLIWNISAGISMWSSAAVVNNIVYFGSNDNNMYAVDAHTGRKIWNYSTAGQIRDSPAVVDGVVYIGSQDGYFYALNAMTGQMIWRSHTGDNDTYTNSSPAVVNDTVFVGSCDHNLYAFQATDGRLKWKYTTGAKVSSSPAVFNGVVYVGSEDHNLYAIDSSTGMKLWNQTLNGPVYSSPAVADGLVFIGSYPELRDPTYPGNIIYAFDAGTGDLVWDYTTAGGVFSAPTVAGGVVFVGSYDNNVYAFGSSYNPGNISSQSSQDSQPDNSTNQQTPSNTTSPSSQDSSQDTTNTSITKVAWVPPAQNGVAATLVTVGVVSIAAVGIAAATSSASASGTSGIVGKLIDKVREFLPKTVKSWIEGVVASKNKLKIEAKTGSPFLPTKSEVIVYIISIIVLTFSFTYVEVNDFSQLWLVLPTFFATSIIVALVKTYILTVLARKRGVWTEFKLWNLGIIMFIVSSLAFRMPFSSPTRTVHHSKNFTERHGVLLSCTGVFITLGFAGFFFILLKSGLILIGATGLAMCLIGAFFEMFPLEPMSGKTIFKYNKIVWVGLFGMTLGFYAAWLLKVF